jgi:hypothetical protein
MPVSRDVPEGGGRMATTLRVCSLLAYRPATRLDRAEAAPVPTALTACTVNR